MHLFGPTTEGPASHPQSSTTAIPFTFTFTRIQTSDSETAPFLRLPAELRNKIYELASKDQRTLRLFEGQIVLPPLGRVCKKIRTEMRGIFEQEAISNTVLGIEALVVNFNFKPLFEWLDERDQRTAFTHTGRSVRLLHIRVACRPELSLIPWFEESSPRCSILGGSLKKQRLEHLLLENLMATMTGWSWELTMFMSGHPKAFTVSPHRFTQAPIFHANARCRRIKTGHHYQIAFIADDTWCCLDDTTSTTSRLTNQKMKSPFRNPENPNTNFYTKIYEALVCDESMRTDVDRKLALALREACRSRCSRAERDAVAVFTDLSPIRMYIGPGTLYTRLYWKWAFIIFVRAAKELSRLEADLRVEKQKRHELLTAKKVEKAAKDARDRRLINLNRAAEDHESWRPLRAKVDSDVMKAQHDMARRSIKRLKMGDLRLTHQQRASRSGLVSDGAEDELEELTRLMARWHL